MIVNKKYLDNLKLFHRAKIGDKDAVDLFEQKVTAEVGTLSSEGFKIVVEKDVKTLKDMPVENQTLVTICHLTHTKSKVSSRGVATGHDSWSEYGALMDAISNFLKKTDK